MEIPQDWNEFISLIDPLQRLPLQRELLKKIVKVPNIKERSYEEIQQYFRNKFQITRRAERSKWHVEDKYFLIWCVSKLVQKLEIQFKELDSHRVFLILSKVLLLPEDFLLKKWLSLLKQSLKNQPWTQQEDELLIQLKEKYNGKNQWTEITEEFIKSTKTMRYQKQIRERYNNVINPQINKDPFSKDEIFYILNTVKDQGKHWANISKHLPGRTDNKIKNIYNSVLRQIGKKLGKQFDDPENEKYILTQFKLYHTYDPTELLDQIERAKQVENNVKLEPAQDSSTLSNQLQQHNFRNTVYYAAQQHPQTFYSFPPPIFIYPTVSFPQALLSQNPWNKH